MTEFKLVSIVLLGIHIASMVFLVPQSEARSDHHLKRRQVLEVRPGHMVDLYAEDTEAS